MFSQFCADYNGEDRFLSRIGVGGLINMEKIHQAHLVLNDIHLFHTHAKVNARLERQAKEEERWVFVLGNHQRRSVYSPPSAKGGASFDGCGR